MDILRSSAVPAFLDLAGDFLEAREAEHNLIFGICSSIEADPTQYAYPPYLATVTHGDKVVGAAIRTPPWRLVLSMFDHPGGIHRLADDLVMEPLPLPGAVGPAESAGHFAEAWRERTGATTRLNRHERSFRLERLIPPRPASGHLVRADESHRDTLATWAKAFHDEALTGNPDHDWLGMADRWISDRAGRFAHLWIDGGRPVSMAGSGGLTPHGIRVGPVYTPPELRGRGYASNVVAGATRFHLDRGRQFLFLFTDLANPTANRIYQAIGYEPVCDIDEWEFEPAP